jgi:hypothetical protein
MAYAAPRNSDQGRSERSKQTMHRKAVTKVTAKRPKNNEKFKQHNLDIPVP